MSSLPIAPANAKLGFAAIFRVAIYCHLRIRMCLIGLTPLQFSKRLCCRPHDELVNIDIRRLLDGKGNGSGNGVGFDGNVG